MESRENLGQYTWLSNVKFILSYCGMQEVWFNPQTVKNGSIASKCNIILRNKFVEYWSSLLHNQHSNALNSQKDSNLPGNNKLTVSEKHSQVQHTGFGKELKAEVKHARSHTGFNQATILDKIFSTNFYYEEMFVFLFSPN